MIISFVLVSFLAILAVAQVGRRKRQAQERANLFGPVLPIFDTYRLERGPHGWPRMTGKYSGLRVKLEVVEDDLSLRKLPSLWLQVTVLDADPTRGTLGFLVGPRDDQVFTTATQMDTYLPVPQGWNQDAVFTTNNKEKKVDLRLLEPFKKIFGNPKAKELVVTPFGVRLTYQAAQASRAEYLVFRRAQFPAPVLDPQFIALTLGAAHAISSLNSRKFSRATNT